MIISYQHQFIFFAVPKTGTHSIRQALRLHMGPADLEQVGLFVTKRFPFPEFANVPHGHINAREIRPVLGDERFGQLFKFAFVRNPYERFVSFCAFMTRQTNEFKQQPRAVMKSIITSPSTLNHLLCRPQYEFLVDDAGRLAMDFVGRNEHMQASYDSICAKLGIPSQPLGRANASQHRPWQDYYDDELVRLVGNVYWRDLELFGYGFDRHVA
jgi:hypothetical protein